MTVRKSCKPLVAAMAVAGLLCPAAPAAAQPGGSARLDEGEAKVGPPHEPGGSARLDEGEAKLGPPHEPSGSARLDEGEAKLGPPHEPGDAGFLGALDQMGISYPSPADALAGGQAVCRYLAEGHSPNQAAKGVKNANPSLTLTKASQFVGVARVTFCDQI